LKTCTTACCAVLAAAFILSPFLCAQKDAPAAAGEDVLAGLVREHPRLILSGAELERLKALHESDAVLRKCVRDALAAADGALGKPALVHKLIGPRLLSVSRECLNRIYALCLAWRWTGDEKYAAAARDNLLTVCAFPDWNPSHFLDTAEMSHAVGVGYDWLFGYLDAESRETIKKGLIANGLEPGLAAYKGAWWVRSAFNWNQVCNGGLVAGALAVAETDPEYARTIVAAARASLPRALESYEPDGAWAEGPGYWNYATSYTAYGLAAMQSALGTDFGLSERGGLAAAGRFPLQLTGPAGRYLNFADCGERSRRYEMPCLFWLARRYGDAFLAHDEHGLLARRPAGPLHVIWYVPPPAEGAFESPPLVRLFRGPVEIAVFRSAWGDPQALFAGVKAGYNQVNHGHLDLGNFELDALGVRWARDLGADDYNLPGYWDGRKNGKRWSYYRLNSLSHSVPVVGGKGQDPDGTARIERFESGNAGVFAVVDLGKAYGDRVQGARRGVALTADRRALLVQDEFAIDTPCTVTWAMTTDAQIEIDGADRAILTIGEKTLEARILAPAGARFAVESAEQEPPQKENKGVRRLLVPLDEREGAVCIAVLLAPVWPEGGAADSPEVAPIASW